MNKRGCNDQGVVYLGSFVLGLAVIGVAQHVAARDLLPPPDPQIRGTDV
jgi:hypothetical protein